ncbi:MAG: penicillin acylase family protein [Burkholderiales bacterium]|nr:penicillin acylase family protein [Burkholderiales bacterium]
MRWLKRTLLGLIVTVALIASSVGVYAWRSVPADEAQYALSSAAGKIGDTTIHIDSDGIPSIDAKSERDLAFAVGFMHARDRLWQLEMHRRIGRGELAEILGPKALETDRFLRTLGVHRAARAQLANLPAEARDLLQAYADGVNGYVREAMIVRPPEFVILGVQPGTWEPADTVAWAIMMAYDLGGNWSNELLRLQLAARMPVARIDELLPAQPGDTLPQHADYAARYKALGVLPSPVARMDRNESSVANATHWLSAGIEGIGSNNWVVNGSRTTTGKPLLANDPHLSLAAPAIWYFTRQKAPGIEVSGATLPGAPSVILGRTQGVAWGFTNTGPDVQDLYIEEINAQGEARIPDGWQKLKTRVETLKVKGKADVTMTVRESRHGPIISDANAPLAAAINGKKFAIALRWTALDADNLSVLAAPAMNKAQTVADVRAALRHHVAPQQNVVMADTQGNTAFIAAGRVPVRKPENDINGLAPVPGWDSNYDWAGFVPYEQLPQQAVDAFLATANQRIHGNDYAHYITSEWAHPGRKRRIEELLAAKPKHDAQSLREIQHDLKHTHDKPLLQWLPQLASAHPLAAEAIRVLRNSGEITSVAQGDGAIATLLYWSWAREATRRIFADDVGPDLFNAIFGRRDFRAALNGVLARADESWCDDLRTPARERCDGVIAAAFDAALDTLQATHGADMRTWRWDTTHFARSEHRPFSSVPVLKHLFEIRTPTSGDTYSVMVGKVRGREPNPFSNEFAASLRAVYDLSLADANAATIIYSTGQSGNPFSPHYRDLAQRWGSGGPGAYIDLRSPTVRGTLRLRGH